MHRSYYGLTSQDKIPRPQCPMCGAKMLLARIEPAAQADHDHRSFECPECGHDQSTVVKFK